ncbi:MAG TPA: methyltransferase domain-containing protein [Pirellulales bacterium]|nr:methyltransferase domain-containing protein [Pirellulales bacterium]
MAAPLHERFDIATVEVSIAGRRYELLKPRDADALLDEEEFEHDDRIPYWAELWPSARVLAELLAKQADCNRRLIELGCGVGLASLAAQAAGFDVLATDYYDDALDFVRANAQRNQLGEIATRMVDWRHLPDDLGRFDLVVAADVLYERPNSALVAATILHSLAAHGEALVTDPRRGAAAGFADECRRRELLVRQSEIPIMVDGKDYTIDLYRISRSGS